MLRTLFFVYAMLCLTIGTYSQAGDTTIVQTFTHEAQNDPSNAYDSPGRRWFDFPASDNGLNYQKILMYYNLKCFSDGTAGNLGYPCGEWDYLTYTYLFDHTGVIDSISAEHPLYMVNNLDFDQANLTSQHVYINREYQQHAVVIDEVLNEANTVIGNASANIAGPFSSNLGQRSLYLYRADELMAAGLTAGADIGKIAMSFSGVPSNVQLLEIGAALTPDNEVEHFYPLASFTTLYTRDTEIAADGWLDFNTTQFTWDGTSNLLLQVFHTNPSGDLTSLLSGEETAYHSAFISSGNDRYMKFDWQDEVRVPKEVFEEVSDQISISFWQYGDPASQPQDGTIFEAVNAQNQRVLNAHLPWSNGNVYWDAGNNAGGFDRINKLATTTQYEGKWNHWCFTKDASSGVMKIFLNGVQWHTGSNMDNLMQDIERFSIGGATSWSNFYNGAIDEFAVFNTALEATDILAWMNQDLNSNHPFWNNLQVYYQFNETNGEMVMDASGHNRHAWMHGNAARIAYKGNEVWRNAGADYYRPQLRITTGDFTSHIESSVGTWLEEIPPVSIAEYDAIDHTPMAIDVEYAWEEQESYLITADGDTITQSFVAAEYTLNNEDFSYWQAPFEIIDRYELNRFITMYGIQLTLGTDGWTWVTDVTDWAPLLRDSVELESGNWQELLDLKFVFIEGEPARDVLRVERIWDANPSLSNFDNEITDKVIPKLPGENMWKIATTATGHGFGNDNNNCGEFCNNIHSVEVNSQEHWSWDIIQECAVNPLFPQGGTWIYDRAGWCPGMNSTTNEFELTPYVVNGDNFTLDYDVEYDPYGNYVFFTTLFGYGAPNHQHDPEIQMITAPSDWKIHSRWNPICDNPKFILRNKGELPLTDLNIYFGVIGGIPQAFHWTGNLAFMESEEVELTSTDAIMWQGDDEEQLRFYIQLGLSSDGADDNPSNNYAENNFYRPPVHQYSDLDDNRLIIQLKTNNANQQSSYTLYDQFGNIVFDRSDFDLPMTTYRDTVQLNSGCYMFHLRDSGEDGLSFFANDDGNGNCKFDRVSGLDFHSFEADFGKEIIYYFYWNTDLVAVDEQPELKSTLRIYPNPAHDNFTLELTGMERRIDVSIYDSRGNLVSSEMISRRNPYDTTRISSDALAPGLYNVRVTDGKKTSVVKLVKQ